MELSLSDRGIYPHSPESSSLPSSISSSYDPMSLSSQLQVLGETGETLTEEEEPLPEDPLAYGTCVLLIVLL